MYLMRVCCTHCMVVLVSATATALYDHYLSRGSEKQVLISSSSLPLSPCSSDTTTCSRIFTASSNFGRSSGSIYIQWKGSEHTAHRVKYYYRVLKNPFSGCLLMFWIPINKKLFSGCFVIVSNSRPMHRHWFYSTHTVGVE